jgi:pentose-5-phosphate-3-epimerase
VAINPATSAAVLEEILPDLDQVLVMTVNPGFGHQDFLKSTLPKIRRVALMIRSIRTANWEWTAELMKQPLRWQSRRGPMCW